MINIPLMSNVHDDNTSVSSSEWALIELNGELIPPKLQRVEMISACTNKEHVAKRNVVELGSVYFDSKGIPTMICGSHELKGSCQVLSQPLVLLQPVPTGLGKTQKQTRPILEEPLQPAKGYFIAGIVKQKLLFNSYPKIIMR